MKGGHALHPPDGAWVRSMPSPNGSNRSCEPHLVRAIEWRLCPYFCRCRSDFCKGACRPIEASKVAICNGRFTSTPAARRRFSPPADPRDLADPVAFALWFEGHRRFHNSEDGVRASLKARQSRRQDAEFELPKRMRRHQGGSGRWRRLCSRGSSMPTGRNHSIH